jgi:hypothetical protein
LWQLSEDGIKFSMSILRSGGASSVTGGRLDFFSPVDSLYLVYVPSDVRFSSSAMAAALARWSLGVLTRRLSLYVLEQALLGERMGAPLAHSSACNCRYVVQRSFCNFLLLLDFLVLLLKIMNRSVDF